MNLEIEELNNIVGSSDSTFGSSCKTKDCLNNVICRNGKCKPSGDNNTGDQNGAVDSGNESQIVINGDNSEFCSGGRCTEPCVRGRCKPSSSSDESTGINSIICAGGRCKPSSSSGESTSNDDTIACAGGRCTEPCAGGRCTPVSSTDTGASSATCRDKSCLTSVSSSGLTSAPDSEVHTCNNGRCTQEHYDQVEIMMYPETCIAFHVV